MAVKAKKPVAEAPAAQIEATGEVVPPAFPGLNYDEFTELGRDNLTAVLKANEAFSEGIEAIGKELLGFARESFESASNAATAFLAAKTLDEVVQLNSDLAKSSVETLMQHLAKLSELGVTVANETLAPIGSRVEAAIAKLTKPLAA